MKTIWRRSRSSRCRARRRNERASATAFDTAANGRAGRGGKHPTHRRPKSDVAQGTTLGRCQGRGCHGYGCGPTIRRRRSRVLTWLGPSRYDCRWSRCHARPALACGRGPATGREGWVPVGSMLTAGPYPYCGRRTHRCRRRKKKRMYQGLRITLGRRRNPLIAELREGAPSCACTILSPAGLPFRG